MPGSELQVNEFSTRSTTLGNAVVLVLVNSQGSYWDYSIVDATILTALQHFGMPYRVVDLSRMRLTDEMLSACSVVVIAQSRLGSRLSPQESRLIQAAVAEGVGFVSFDADVRRYEPAILEIFGFGRINPHPYATDVVRIRNNEHAVTNMQDSGAIHQLDRMVTAVAIESWRDDVVPLAEGVLGKDQLVYTRHLAPWSAYEPRNYPILFAARWGNGKAVQFAINPRIWRREFYGHARALDDLFWRSVVWAARKPFAANMLPPFVAMSFDDCSGRHDFAYAEIAAERGFLPMVGLFLKSVPDRLMPKISGGLSSGRILYTTHALDYYSLMGYHYGRGEMSESELRDAFAYEDMWWNRIGASPGETVRAHMGEIGVNALPYLKARGRRFLCPALQVGLPKAEMCYADGYEPYGLQTCYYDYLPDDDDFFGFASMGPRFHEDFLSGSTTYLRESATFDAQRAAAAAESRIRQALGGGFFAELLTHEQKLDDVPLEEWGRLIDRIRESTADMETIPASHDRIGKYLRDKHDVRIEIASTHGQGIRCSLKGTCRHGLKLSVFTDEGDGVVRRYRTVDAFEGHAQVLLDA